MKRWKMLLQDLTIAVLIGAAIAFALFLLLLAAGLLMAGFQLERAMAVTRSGLLLIGALGLFVCAGLLLTPRSRNRIPAGTQWTRWFHSLDLVPILAIIAVLILLAASAVDYIVWAAMA